MHRIFPNWIKRGEGGDYEWNTSSDTVYDDASTREILTAETKMYGSVFREKDISAASWYTKLQLIKLFVNCWYRLKILPRWRLNCGPVTRYLPATRKCSALLVRGQRNVRDGRRRPTISMHYRIIYLRTAKDLCTVVSCIAKYEFTLCAPDVQRTGMRSWINIDSRRYSPFIWNKDTRW